MAIYHFHAERGRRWGSAAAKFAYITRDGKYAKCSDVVLHSESGHMPGWAEAKPATFWEAADTYERRNGRLYQEYDFALPVELSLEQQVAVASAFAQHITAEHTLPYSLAIHAGNETNPHCHLVLNERVNDGLERGPRQWFSRYNKQNPGAGGAKKNPGVEREQVWVFGMGAGAVGGVCEHGVGGGGLGCAYRSQDFEGAGD